MVPPPAVLAPAGAARGLPPPGPRSARSGEAALGGGDDRSAFGRMDVIVTVVNLQHGL